MCEELYPYQNQYEFYLKTVKQYKTQTLNNANVAINKFWNYYLASYRTTSIKDVTEDDVRAFFDFSENNFKNSTLNKFLVHLKNYFAWLSDHNLIDKLPTLFIKGKPIERKNRVVINWLKYIDDFMQDTRLSSNTRKSILAISLGYLPNDLITLKNADIFSHLNSKTIFNLKNINVFSNKMNKDEYYFQSKKRGHVGEPLKTNVVIRKSLKDDNEYLPFRANLISLRQSYVYTLVADNDFNDRELLKILHCNLKTLTYYKDNVLLFDLVDYLKIRNKYLNSQKIINR